MDLLTWRTVWSWNGPHNPLSGPGTSSGRESEARLPLFFAAKGGYDTVVGPVPKRLRRVVPVGRPFLEGHHVSSPVGRRVTQEKGTHLMPVMP